MRALRFSTVGDPMEVLHLDDLPSPEPGPSDVRVRMTHRPINPSDLLTVQGYYPLRRLFNASSRFITGGGAAHRTWGRA